MLQRNEEYLAMERDMVEWIKKKKKGLLYLFICFQPRTTNMVAHSLAKFALL